tara:strand:+ start:38 stop:511 length:474 start_codon:yes stop_codon:yes gene_type:complete
MITVKSKIDFSKLLKEFENKRLNQTLNTSLSPRLADILKEFIKKPNNGLEKLSSTQLNVRRHTYKVDRKNPLWMTGNLLNSLKGSKKGLEGVSYINKGKENHADGYTWKSPHPDKVAKQPEVPSRNIMMGYTEKEKVKNIEDFKKDFIKLLNKRIRK